MIKFKSFTKKQETQGQETDNDHIKLDNIDILLYILYVLL